MSTPKASFWVVEKSDWNGRCLLQPVAEPTAPPIVVILSEMVISVSQQSIFSFSRAPSGSEKYTKSVTGALRAAEASEAHVVKATELDRYDTERRIARYSV